VSYNGSFGIVFLYHILMQPCDGSNKRPFKRDAGSLQTWLFHCKSAPYLCVESVVRSLCLYGATSRIDITSLRVMLSSFDMSCRKRSLSSS
jgi:hypothetical protein